MPPRRSTRSTTAFSTKPASKPDVLTFSSSPEPPPPKRARTSRTTTTTAAAASGGSGGGTGGSRTRAVLSLSSADEAEAGEEEAGNEGGAADDEDDKEDADAALARRLQDEENAMAGVGLGGAQASTSAAAAAGPSRRSSPRKRASSVSSSAAASASTAAAPAAHAPPELPKPPHDPNDPLVLLEGEKVALRGEGRCACGGEIRAVDKLPLTPTSTLASYLALGGATCPSCAKEVCRGCWGFLPNEEGTGAGECCAQGRVVVIFQLLAALDDVYLADHLSRPAPAPVPVPAASTSTSVSPAKGKGKSKGKGKGKKAVPAAPAPPVGAGAGTGYGSGHTYAYDPYAYGAEAGNGTGYSYGGDGYNDGFDGMNTDDEYEMWLEDRVADMDAEGDWMEQDDFYNGEGTWEEFVQWREERRREKGGKEKKENPAASAASAHDASQDALYTAFLTLLIPLLPAPDSPTATMLDFLPSPHLLPLLALSTLPDLLATLLRNDAVPEWHRRSGVYFAMLGALEALAGVEVTMEGVFGARREKKWSEGLWGWASGEGEVQWAREGVSVEVQVEVPVEVEEEKGKGKGKGRKRKVDEAFDAPKTRIETVTRTEELGQVVMAVPLFTLLRKLSTQASAFQRAAATGALDDSEADAALIGICGDFAAAGERCAALAGMWEARVAREAAEAAVVGGPAEGEGEAREGEGGGKGGKGKGKAREWTDADYERACAKLAYGTVEMGVEMGEGKGVTFPTHYYRRDIESSASSRRSHASFVHLAKELAVLSTSLPPGIWVRVDEARVDVLKCLIAGPPDSPYAGGLFEFDLFVPLAYPQVPPQCWLRTTGEGKCRYNPNLYAEGKVCLSLLGTWASAPEEQWQPGKSTILQILLSITSMILGTSFPFYNEPGFGAPRDDIRNQNYNKNVSLATARWAILDWIEGDKGKASMWSDIILSHFLLNRAPILSALSTWAGADPRMRSWTPALNATAGTDRLEPYNWGRGYGAGLDGMFGAGLAVKSGGGAKGKAKAKKGKGKGKGKAAAEDDDDDDEPAPAAPPKPAEPVKRDLVKEIEAAMERLEGWREQGWVEGLVKGV
ncbi:hypothetical protein JCM10207_006215 [Rhodosporidiobolus poonsookiae]